MCLAVQYDDVQTEELLAKKPNTITMWRVFRKRKDGGLCSMGGGENFPRSGSVHVRIPPYPKGGIDRQGFHCFLTRKDARKIRAKQTDKVKADYRLLRHYVVRKVLVKKSDVVAIGETYWYYGFVANKKTDTTRTAIVKEMDIQRSLFSHFDFLD